MRDRLDGDRRGPPADQDHAPTRRPRTRSTTWREAEHAELIVVGSSHTGRLGRVAPGSTGERLLHGAPCAVAIVPDGYRTRARAADPPDRRRLRRLRRGRPPPSPRRSNWLAPSSAELEIIGVVAPETYAGSGMLGGAVDRHARGRTRALRPGRASTPSSPGCPRTSRPRACGSRATRPTNSANAAQSLDLMLAGSRGYGPLRSVLVGGVSGRLMHTVQCPVIVVPRGVEAPLANALPESGGGHGVSRPMEVLIVVPAPGADSISSVPRTSAKPLADAEQAEAGRAFLRVEALAVVAHRHIDGAVAVADPDVLRGWPPRA